MKKFFAFHRQTQKQSRRKHFIKKQALLSLILICAFLFGSLPPVSLIAAAVPSQPSQNRATEAQARVAAGFADPRELHDENALVVEEVTSLRDAYSKQYRLSNGEVAVYTYSDPLHFEKNGAWVDLDHTLTAQNGRFVNTSAPIQVSFAQSTGDDSLFSFAYQNHSVDFSLMGVKQSSTSQTVLSLSANATARLSSASSAQDGVIASPQSTKNLVGKTAAEASSLRPGYTTSSIAYQAVSPGMDLTYTLSGFSARKEITLTSASAWKEPLFSMNTTLTPALSADGSIALSDTSGKEILTLPAPYMYDAAGEISTDVHYTLVSVKDFWLLSVTLDEEWLNAEERVFPVVVDPTVEVTGTSNVTDTMIREGSPTNTYNSMKYAVVGYSTTSSSKRNWGLYKMKTMPSIPSTAILTSATLKVRQLSSANGNYSWSNSSVSSMQISAKMVLGTWAAAATWNARPAVDEAFPLDTKTLSASTAGQDFTFDIFDAYNAWHSGWYQFDTAVDNWGIQFSRHTDTGSSPNCYTSFYTSEHSTAANKPVFAVYYNTASATLSDDIYLFNNRYSGKFLRYNNSALSMQSGTMANLGSSVAWDVQYVGSYYVIESTAAPGTFLAASATSGSAAVETVSATATTVPTRAQWTITNASGGGCLVKNAANNRYLTVSGSSVQTTATLGSAGTEQYWRNTWRVPLQDIYDEMSSGFSVEILSLRVDEEAVPNITLSDSSAHWTGIDDFTFTATNITHNPLTGKIKPTALQTITVSAVHKPTGLSATFLVLTYNKTVVVNNIYDYGFKLLYDDRQPYELIPAMLDVCSQQFQEKFHVKLVLGINALVLSQPDLCKGFDDEDSRDVRKVTGNYCEGGNGHLCTSNHGHPDDTLPPSVCTDRFEYYFHYLDNLDELVDESGNEINCEAPSENNLYVFWTGHQLHEGNGDKDNHSFAYELDRAVGMQQYLSNTNAYYREITHVLLHELCHLFGPDNHEGDDECIMSDNTPYAEVMDLSYPENFGRTILCQNCFDTIQDYLSDNIE